MTTLIAIAIEESGEISPFAGRALHWEIFAIDEDKRMIDSVWTIQLTEAGSLHLWHTRDEGSRHPLHQVEVAIAGSAGDGVINHLAARATQLITTEEKDPAKALQKYLNQTLGDGIPEEEQECLDPEKRQERSNKML